MLCSQNIFSDGAALFRNVLDALFTEYLLRWCSLIQECTGCFVHRISSQMVQPYSGMYWVLCSQNIFSDGAALFRNVLGALFTEYLLRWCSLIQECTGCFVHRISSQMVQPYSGMYWVLCSQNIFSDGAALFRNVLDALFTEYHLRWCSLIQECTGCFVHRISSQMVQPSSGMYWTQIYKSSVKHSSSRARLP